ncbi:hypothetical protein [Edaphocola flava]|uniref:hypothetical protein n=1 Tax=Edaphocola flava TaxID=2499629 RepID=UPI00100A305E|nr:hypothetical protein [Edaphocola flava]
MYHLDMFKKGNLLFVFFICSCNIGSNKRDVVSLDKRAIYKHCLAYESYLKLDNDHMTSSDAFFDSLTNTDIRDTGLYIRLLNVIMNVKDESESENIGSAVYIMLINYPLKGNDIDKIIDCFPDSERNRIKERIVEIMDIDLISDNYNEEKFLRSFPFFSNSIYLKAFKKVKENKNAGEW